jgi:hypothetical protein
MIVTRIASPALYWPADEVGSQTHGRLRPGDLSLLYNACHILSICLVEIHWCLVLCAKSWGLAELGRLGNLLEGLQEVEWAINEVGWAHGQVVGPSNRSEPLVGDGRERGRWGPRGTHVSQASWSHVYFIAWLLPASRSCHEVLNELIPEVLFSTLKSCINTKLVIPRGLVPMDKI